MSDNAHAKRFADSLRSAADLVERGLIECEATIDYDIESRPDGRTGMVKVRHTGYQTVTIVLRGNPTDFSSAGWTENPSALKSLQPALPASPDQETLGE